MEASRRSREASDGPASEYAELVKRALAEDLGSGDVTSRAVVPSGRHAAGVIVQKEPGVLFGLEVTRECFRELDPRCSWDELALESEWLEEVPVEVARVEGRARAMLAAERTALNFLGRLSGIATLTARCVRAVEGTGTRILDTRKTTPGIRHLEKQAVRAGGGFNHRFGLYDAFLIKANHVKLAGGVGKAVCRAVEASKGRPVEVECSSLTEAEEAMAAGASRLLLDNMSVDELRQVAERLGDRVQLEASGGITPATVRDFAVPHVQFISMGALTHSAPALDLSFRVRPL